MRHKWEIEKKDFKKSLLYELRKEKCVQKDFILAQDIITYLVTFLPLNYAPGRKLEVVPTLAGLSLYTGITKEELEQKGKDIKIFKKLFSYLYAVQEARVLALSLKGKVNYRIASLVLFNHGYKAKKKEEIPVSDNPLELIIKFTGAEYTPLLKVNPEKLMKRVSKFPPRKANDLLEQEIANIKTQENETAK